MLKKVVSKVTIGILVICQSGLYCHSAHSTKNKTMNHSAAIYQKDGSSIYIDRVLNDRLLASKSLPGDKTEFHSFKITFEDSTYIQSDDKQKTTWTKYFNYEMERNWSLIDHKDSLSPVLFQPLIKHSPLTDEGVLIFEVIKGHQPDTLVYQDPNKRQNQLFILKD